ncbi:MAG: hypothetical protein FJ076_07335 [Cyanobacteria bacterium K_DeepCast_35m_m1_288]|nr:hypothetical protein [Cyanobacteria bacterium K_DeepCast_35m_m1_288]
MPINEKGEFIRARPSAKGVGASAARPDQGLESSVLSSEELFTLAKGLGALLLLAGLIWFVVAFHEWIAIGLGLWLVNSLRAWLR